MRAAGVDSDLLSVLQLPATLVLLVGVFALIDIELSPIVPGANDNASGVATALSLAAELKAEPPSNLDVWIVLTGGEECLMQGMRSFVRAHAASWTDPRRTSSTSTPSAPATSASRSAKAPHLRARLAPH